MFRYSKDKYDIVRGHDPYCNQNEDAISVYCCDVCSEEYLSETEVDIHRKSKHKTVLEDLIYDAKKTVCKICAVQYTTQEVLMKHLKTIHLLSTPRATHVEREIFICNHCQQIYFNKDLLSIHMTHHHSIKDKYTTFVECPKCNKLLRLQYIWHHFQYHQIQSISSCPICLFKCKDRLHLQTHAKTHPSHFHCNICGFTTKREESFRIHVNEHCKSQESTGKDKKQYTDDYYKRYFMPRNAHSITAPTLNKPWGWKGLKIPDPIYICIMCRYICTNTKEMKKHIDIDHQYKEQVKKKYYTCACGELFENKILLKHHVFKLKEDHRMLEDTEIAETSMDTS